MTIEEPIQKRKITLTNQEDRALEVAHSIFNTLAENLKQGEQLCLDNECGDFAYDHEDLSHLENILFHFITRTDLYYEGD